MRVDFYKGMPRASAVKRYSSMTHLITPVTHQGKYEMDRICAEPQCNGGEAYVRWQPSSSGGAHLGGQGRSVAEALLSLGGLLSIYNKTSCRKNLLNYPYILSFFLPSSTFTTHYHPTTYPLLPYN